MVRRPGAPNRIGQIQDRRAVFDFHQVQAVTGMSRTIIDPQLAPREPGDRSFAWRVRQTKRAPVSGPFDLFVSDSGGDDVLRLRALLTLRNGELDPLPFGERFEALALDCTVVCKNVGARFLLDEAEAFGLVEPFHGSGSS